MTHKSRHALESCTYQLHNWKPFQLQTLTRTLDSDLSTNNNPKPYSPTSTSNGVHNKRPCFCDRSFSIDSLDMSKLSLFEDDRSSVASHKRERFPWIARKRRRRGSRSVSGRSSDKSGTRRLSVGASGAYATCSDFPVAAGTDSSGELFVNGDANWSSDVSEAKNSRKDGRESGGSGEKESSGFGSWQTGGFDAQGNESGYGSEPGYRGDAELGYGDEFDEEEDDGRVLFWGERFGDASIIGPPFPLVVVEHTVSIKVAPVFSFGPGSIVCLYFKEGWTAAPLECQIALDLHQDGDTDCSMDIVGDTSFSEQKVGDTSFSEQKTHHRCRRKKHDWRMVGMSR